MISTQRLCIALETNTNTHTNLYHSNRVTNFLRVGSIFLLAQRAVSKPHKEHVEQRGVGDCFGVNECSTESGRLVCVMGRVRDV